MNVPEVTEKETYGLSLKLFEIYKCQKYYKYHSTHLCWSLA